MRYIAIIICGLILAACPSLWKNAQLVKLTDDANKTIGGIAAFKVHYANNADKEFPDDHFSIVISNANTGEELEGIPVISDDELAKVSAIGVVDTSTGKYVTGESSTSKDVCDQSIDPKNPGFGCQILTSKLGETKIVYIRLKLKDGKFWKSENIDLNKATDSSELGAEMQDIVVGIGTGKPLELTLKSCAPNDGGIIIDVTIDKECPTGTVETTNIDTNTDTNKDCPPPNIKDKDGKCISVLQPKALCNDNTVMLLNGSCSADCGSNQVQKMGKCQCQTGYMKDATGSNCVIDPSYNVNPPPASSSGGGSCSLIKTSVPPTPIATPKTYDLKDTGLVPGASVLPDIVNQLKDVTLVRGTSSDGHDTYTLKATFKASYNGKNYGQASELSAVDTSTGTAIKLVPRNTTATGEHLCMPVVSGDTAKFSCIYRVSENATLPTGTLYLSLTIPKVMTLTTATTVDAKDFEAKEALPAPPPPPPAPVCKDPTPILLPSGVCGVDPNTNVPPASGGPTGNNCSLTPLASSGAEIKTILALLLCTMLAARACHSSRN